MAELPQPLIYLSKLILVYVIASLGMAAIFSTVVLLFRFLCRLARPSINQ